MKLTYLVNSYNKMMKYKELQKELKNDLMKYSYEELSDDVRRLEYIHGDKGDNEMIHEQDEWKIYKLIDYKEAMKLIGNN